MAVTMDSSKPASSSTAAAVQVYLRIRPLIAEEEGHEVVEYKASNDKTSIRVKLPADGKKLKTAFAHAEAPPVLKHRQETWKTYDGYTGILEADCDNQQTYSATVQPLIPLIKFQQLSSACVFTYGHTGSGKSHTLLGYGDQLGMYKFAAADLLDNNNDDDKKCLWVRVTELYQENARDLISGRTCSIRQDGDGKVQVRGPMTEDDQGRIEQALLGKLCRTPEEVVECIEIACANRRVGTSTHHSQSSRSHLLLEMELVTPELVEKRQALLRQDAHLNRLKWLQTERFFGKHHDPAKKMPKWTKEYNDNPRGGSTQLRKDIEKHDNLVKATQKEIKEISSSNNLGGTMVFCDLAGNEYARDSARSTRQEADEAALINKSLLAVKEMIRGLASGNNKSGFVPYRDSTLTMVLKRHLVETRAIMLAHVSPSQQSITKTINTLNYSSMATASNNSADSKKKTKTKLRGKENHSRRRSDPLPFSKRNFMRSPNEKEGTPASSEEDDEIPQIKTTIVEEDWGVLYLPNTSPKSESSTSLVVDPKEDHEPTSVSVEQEDPTVVERSSADGSVEDTFSDPRKNKEAGATALEEPGDPKEEKAPAARKVETHMDGDMDTSGKGIIDENKTIPLPSPPSECSSLPDATHETTETIVETAKSSSTILPEQTMASTRDPSAPSAGSLPNPNADYYNSLSLGQLTLHLKQVVSALGTKFPIPESDTEILRQALSNLESPVPAMVVAELVQQGQHQNSNP